MSGAMIRARELLACLGCPVQDGDEGYFALCAQRVAEQIRSCCAVEEIPVEMCCCAGDWIAAEYLDGKRSLGLLESMEGFNYEAAVERIQEGDTTIAYFDHASPEERLKSLIDRLRPREGTLIAYRRMRW